MPLVLNRPVRTPTTPWQNSSPPTLKQLKNTVEDWVSYTVRSVTLSHPHFENSFYGPWNALLGSIFPLTQGFMVKPQAILREVIDTDDVVDVSFGSTGGMHRSRTVAGREKGIKLPDFVVVKPEFGPNGEGDHRFVLVVEIKRSKEGKSGAHLQIMSYLTRASKIQPTNVVYGYLVCGSEVRKYRSFDGDVTEIDLGDILHGSLAKDKEQIAKVKQTDDFADDICGIAIGEWNS